MIGSLNPKSREATVIGGGIAGLLAAYRLDQKGYQVTLLEAQSQAGGMIRTHEMERGISEAAIHSILVTPRVKQLFDELEMSPIEVRSCARARYIFRNGKMRRFPLRFCETLQAVSRACFVRSAGDELSLESWTRKHLGEPALRYLVGPFVNGIYGAHPRELLVPIAFPKLSIARGHTLFSQFLVHSLSHKLSFDQKSKKNLSRPKMMTFAGGMGVLTERLSGHLRERLGHRWKMGETVSSLPEVENLILTVPTDQAAALINSQDPDLARSLWNVKYSPLLSVTVFLEKRFLTTVPQGVGVLYTQEEGLGILGILFNSSAFPGRVKDESQWISCTIMLGGSHYPEVLTLSDSEILERIQKCFFSLQASLLGFQGQVEDYKIYRYPKAIPQYNDVLQQAWTNAKQGWCSRSGRVLFGNYTGQVSVRGMIESSAEFFT